MTLPEFIKSNLTRDTQLGDLCRDIQGDPQFPIHKSEEDMISYLGFQTDRGGTGRVLNRFLRRYEQQREKQVAASDVETRFALLRTDNWSFFKDNFFVDKVYLVGEPTDIYKVYCVDSTMQKALLFDIKSANSLNDLFLREANDIYFGKLTKVVSVGEAIKQLQDCSYDTPVKPFMPNFKELLAFLQKNV